jgi:small-conductance mechanosensitive channel
VGVEAHADPQLRALLLDEPSVMGVESIEVDKLNIRMVARTLPGKQFDVGRELRSRAATALRREGVHVPPVLDTADPTAVA